MAFGVAVGHGLRALWPQSYQPGTAQAPTGLLMEPIGR